MIAHGDPIEVRGFNRVGMERRGCSDAARRSIKRRIGFFIEVKSPCKRLWLEWKRSWSQRMN